jgi:hypothetical protein
MMRFREAPARRVTEDERKSEVVPVAQPYLIYSRFHLVPFGLLPWLVYNTGVKPAGAWAQGERI